MVSMCSQHKMPSFSLNFLSEKLFQKLKIARTSVETVCFIQNDITPRNENDISTRKRLHERPCSHFDPIIFEKRSNT